MQGNRQIILDLLVKSLVTLVAVCCSLLLVAVLYYILQESMPVWSTVGVIPFVTGMDWSPITKPPVLGIAPMIASTLWVALGALIIAVPLGFSCAIFLAEFAPPWLAGIIRPVLNILTGIPSVVYGFLGAAVLVKFFEGACSLTSGESLFCASIVLSIMVIPFITANSEAALRSVADDYRLAGIALGVSAPYITLRILLPLAKKGMLGSVILAFGRAAGETMAVLMIAGNILKFPTSWFNMGESLPALLALELGSAVPGSLHHQGLFAAGLVLITFVTAINLTIHHFTRQDSRQVKSLW